MGFLVELAKEDFKFSAAHFTIFSPAEAEPLHGHNYRLTVSLRGEALDERDFLVEFSPVKRAIRRLCAELDESVLLPAHSPDLEIRRSGDGTVTVTFADRIYTLPEPEVRLLPIKNVTVEALARWCWRRLVDALDLTGVESLEVAVGETPGQRAAFGSAPTTGS